MRILLIGPCPPPLGGTALSFQYLVEQLQKRKGLAITVVRTRISGGRFKKGWASIVDVVQLVPLVNRHDIVAFHASTERMIFFGFVLRLLCRILRRPFLVRVFGGNLDDVYLASGFIKRRIIEELFTADQVLLQSRALTTAFHARFPCARVEWFPTSRPLVKAIRSRRRARRPWRFLFLGHLRLDKGVGVILNAVDMMKRTDFAVEFFGVPALK